jgi:ketose-bisphosphate aldolase
MALTSMKEMLVKARRGHYAVCYCEAWNLESLEAVVEAAEETRSPVIVGFGGGFLMQPERPYPEPLEYYAGLGLAAAHVASVPVALLLNETDSFDQIKRAIELGFNAIMVENERLSAGEYQELVRQVVNWAHRHEVTVEAQIGQLPAHASAGGHHGSLTDPQDARAFAQSTGVDALAVSIGNIHIMTRGGAAIDLKLLADIDREVGLPLVVHGGTGFPLRKARQAVRCGAAKFNFGTGLKQAYLRSLQSNLKKYHEPMNPHPFVGMGGRKDILVAARQAVKREVIKLLKAFGSAGKAKR